MKNFKKYFVNAMLLVGTVGLLTGCGGSKGYASETATQPLYDTNGAGGTSVGYVTDDYYEEKADVEEAYDEASSGVNVKEKVNNNRKLIRTVNLNVETQDFDGLMEQVEDRVAKMGGYIENMESYNGSTYGRSSSRYSRLTIRVPKENLDEFLEQVSQQANIVRRSENVEDVTLTYVDMESHKKSLQVEEDRLLELLERAESLEDIITLESRLSDVRYQIESMESQLRSFDNKVDYSTVYLNVDEVEIYTPVEPESVWTRISKGFVESLKNVKDGLVDFFILFIVALPYLAVWAIVILGILAVVKAICKRSKKKKQKKQEKLMEAAKKQESETER